MNSPAAKNTHKERKVVKCPEKIRSRNSWQPKVRQSAHLPPPTRGTQKACASCAMLKNARSTHVKLRSMRFGPVSHPMPKAARPLSSRTLSYTLDICKLMYSEVSQPPPKTHKDHKVMKSKKNVYRRNYRGDWFKNGRLMRTNPPARVLRMAQNMQIECTIQDK